MKQKISKKNSKSEERVGADKLLTDKVTVFWEKALKRSEDRYEYKKGILPKKLYKYMNFDYSRESKLESLKNNQIWMSSTKKLNDPYDCLGFYIDKDKLIKNNKINSETIEKLIEAFVQLREPYRLTCFSEELFNMPMWGNYASCHSGICLEYDLENLDEESEFFKLLFPVAYEEERVDLTNTYENLILGKQFNELTLFFTSVVKHISWQYEKEWRYITSDVGNENSEGLLKKLPISPSAVYLGYNISKENRISLIDIYKDTHTNIYSMQMNNERFFNLDIIEDKNSKEVLKFN